MSAFINNILYLWLLWQSFNVKKESIDYRTISIFGPSIVYFPQLIYFIPASHILFEE